jgi:hypothetical protein
VWKDTEGEAQMVDGSGSIVANLVVESLLDYNDAVDAWDVARAAADAPVEVVPPGVPQVVSMRQARLILLQQGLLSQVGDFIETLPEPQRTVAKIEWEYSQEVHRDKELVALLATTLALSSQDLDNLFIAAAAL